MDINLVTQLQEDVFKKATKKDMARRDALNPGKLSKGDRVKFDVLEGQVSEDDWENDGDLTYDQIKSLDGQIGEVVCIDIKHGGIPIYITVRFDNGLELEAVSTEHFEKVV